jgi:hypothetical protein
MYTHQNQTIGHGIASRALGEHSIEGHHYVTINGSLAFNEVSGQASMQTPE